MKNRVLISLTAILIVIASIPVGYCYNSNTSADTTVTVDVNTISMYHEDELCSTLINNSINARPSSTGYTSDGGLVCDGYTLRVQAQGDYNLKITLSGVSESIKILHFKLNDTIADIACENGEGAIICDEVYTYGDAIAISVGVDSFRSDNVDLTLGDVTFTLIKYGDDTSSTTITDNVLSITVSIIEILDSDDAEEVLIDYNGDTVNDNNNSTVYVINSATELNNHPTVIIKSENSTGDNLTTRNTSYSITITIPPNVKYCVVWTNNYGWFSNSTYSYDNNGAVGYTNNMPNVNAWLTSDDDSSVITISGTTMAGFGGNTELRVMLENR